MPDEASAEGVVLELVRQAIWNIAYHEAELTKAHGYLAVVRALAQRCQISLTDKQASEVYDDGDEDDDAGGYSSSHDFMGFLLGKALAGIVYHETNLSLSHRRLAGATSLARRVGVEVPFEEIEARERRRVADR